MHTVVGSVTMTVSLSMHIYINYIINIKLRTVEWAMSERDSPYLASPNGDTGESGVENQS